MMKRRCRIGWGNSQKTSLCCGFRRTGKAIGQAYQCWWRICQWIKSFFFSPGSNIICYILYQFVTYLLTLPRMYTCTRKSEDIAKHTNCRYIPQYMKHMKRILTFQNSVYASQKTHCSFITKTNRLMLFREIIAVYCERHAKHINILCGQNARVSNVKG
jgi:hypothetical protein